MYDTVPHSDRCRFLPALFLWRFARAVSYELYVDQNRHAILRGKGRRIHKREKTQRGGNKNKKLIEEEGR
jgi:hypothetical protein